MSELATEDVREVIDQTMTDVRALREGGPASHDRLGRVIARLMDGYIQIGGMIDRASLSPENRKP